MLYTAACIAGLMVGRRGKEEKDEEKEEEEKKRCSANKNIHKVL